MSYPPAKRTYFGIAAFLTGIMAVLALGANYTVACLNIPPIVFNQWNIITAAFYCALTPLAFTLGFAGVIFKNDFKVISWIAMAMVTIPFLIILVQLVLALVRLN